MYRSTGARSSVASRLDGFGLITHHIIENDRRTGEHVQDLRQKSPARAYLQAITQRQQPDDLRYVDCLRLKLMESSILGNGSSMKRKVITVAKSFGRVNQRHGTKWDLGADSRESFSAPELFITGKRNMTPWASL